MSARRFPLATVLELRATLEKRAEDALALAARQRDAAAGECARGTEELAAIAAQLGGERFRAATRGQGWGALQSQQQTCLRLKQLLADEEKIVAGKRAALLAAARDHDLVERLQGKWRSARQLAAQRAEERTLDDFVSARRAHQLATLSHA